MSEAVSVTESDTLRLSCKVAGVKGQLSVTWQHKATQSAPFTNVISLSREGVMEKAEEFASRKVRASRTAADSFVLEVDEVTPSDAGVYQCAVSEWNTNSKVFSQSQTANVTVDPIGKIYIFPCLCSYTDYCIILSYFLLLTLLNFVCQTQR